ncbi:MAG: long-chain fatty acid--CoA ligase [Proteobacteria bacterium]|nr:long-chain fatty acid--CoA ligase [Pseudomonadota bacterium]
MRQFDKETINEVILWRLEENPKGVAYYAEDETGGFRPVYVSEQRQRLLGTAAGLQARGLGKDGRVAILADVRHEWVQMDFATLLSRGVTVGVYPTCTPDAVQYMLDHAEVRWIAIEAIKYLEGLVDALNACEKLELVIAIEPDGTAPDGLTVPLITLDDLVAEGTAALDEEALKAHAREAEPDDLLTIVYTSGTTGPPKGAMLTHGNLFRTCQAVDGLLPTEDGDRGIVYLPLAHSLQRTTLYLGMWMGKVDGYYLSHIPRLGEVMPIVRPTMLAAVPRVLEKIHAKATATTDNLTGVKGAVFGWGFGIGRQYSALERTGTAPGWLLALQHRIADRLVLSKIREKLGGSIRFIVSGGAPLAPHISEWFHAAGMLVIEGYGLTETSAPATTNTPTNYKFGTVGQAIPGVQLKIADDGEVLIKGPNVFPGYYKDEAATAEAFNEDGWFHSGDIGEIDDDGYLSITDRKKNLIITAGGKNIAPSNIENLLKEHNLIGQAMVCGDAQPYLVALLALDPEDAVEWAEAEGLDCADHAALCTHPTVREAIESHLVDVNGKLARYESIKKWHLVDIPLDINGGYLTPTLKLKRRAILADFGDVVDGLYTQS